MNLEGLAEYIQAKRVGVIGQTVFVNEMPGECEIGILLRDRYSGTPIDHYLKGYRATGFRAAVRSRDFKAGKTLAYKLRDLLTIEQETDMPGMLIKLMLPQNEPRPYRRSRGGFWEWELDVDVHYVIT